MSKRTLTFVTFFSVVLSIYTLLNIYVFWHGWTIVPERYHTVYTLAFWSTANSYVGGRILERLMLNWFTTILVSIGAYWLGAMVYFVLFFLGMDVVRLILSVLPFSWQEESLHAAYTALTLTVGVAVIILLIFGTLNARRLRIKDLHVRLDKAGNGSPPLRLTVASDIHLGTIICRRRIEKIVEKINALDADVVLLPGDVVDEDLAPVIRQNLGEVLRSIKARYGVFAVTGNHEYIGGVEPAIRYLRDHGITVLRDESMCVAGRFTLVGRDDLTSNRFGGGKRKSLAELMNTVDRSLPVVLLDHQPFGLSEAEQNGVDLQLSGHTHHGQLWPFSYITRRVYEVSWGFLQRGKTQYYISSGVGTWGPPLKIGNHAEIVHITISFT